MPVIAPLLILIIGMVAGISVLTDVEAAMAASGLAFGIGVIVAVVFVHRWWITRGSEEVILRWMLASIGVASACVAVLLFYRTGDLLAIAADNALWKMWFAENRIVGGAISLTLAAAMVAKLRYQFSELLGRWWIAAVTAGGAAVFFALALLPRAF